MNLDGPAGTLAALRASNPAAPMMTMTAPISAGLIGPGGNQVSGLIGDEAPGGHGAAIDQALADLDQRVSQLEAGEEGEP